MPAAKKKTNMLYIELIVGCCAILVGLCALFVSIYEAKIFKQQQKASVWPYLEFSYNIYNPGFSYEVQNKGVGPAIIQWVIVKIDGKPISSWRAYAQTILIPDSTKYRISVSSISDRVISPNEKIELFSIKDSHGARLARRSNDKVSFKICYKSIFNDYWIMSYDSSRFKTISVENPEKEIKPRNRIGIVLP